jgi:hypothetical protein
MWAALTSLDTPRHVRHDSIEGAIHAAATVLGAHSFGITLPAGRCMHSAQPPVTLQRKKQLTRTEASATHASATHASATHASATHASATHASATHASATHASATKTDRHHLKVHIPLTPSASAFFIAPCTAPRETSRPTASICNGSSSLACCPLIWAFAAAAAAASSRQWSAHSSRIVPEPQNISKSLAPDQSRRYIAK